MFGVSFCLGRGEWEWVGHFFRSMRVEGGERGWVHCLIIPIFVTFAFF